MYSLWFTISSVKPMAMQLSNKVVFVTGGANGLGEACVRALSGAGAKVVVADVDKTSGSELARELNSKNGKETAMFVSCDVSNILQFKEAFQTAVERWGQVDVMVNNAGVASEVQWERTLDVNLKGVITGTEMALSHMRRDRGGHGGVIVNMASYAGYHPFYMFPVYTASKYGVIGYTRSMANAPDVHKLGVRYACICPRKADTKMIQHELSSSRQEYSEDVANLYAGDLMSPDRVAEGLLSLLADDSSNDTLLEVGLHGHVRKSMIVTDSER